MSPNLFPMANCERLAKSEVWFDSKTFSDSLTWNMISEQRGELGLLLPDYQ